MIKLIQSIKKNYFDNTIDLSKLSKTFLLWGVGLVLVYVANIYLVRLTGLKQYGEYTVFINWVILTSTFVTFGWDGYLVQLIPKLPVNAAGKIEARGMLKRVAATFIFIYAFLAVISFFVTQFFNTTLLFSGSGTVIIFLTLVFFFSAINSFKSVLRIFHKVRYMQWMEDISKPLLFLCILMYCYYFRKVL